MKSLKHIIAVLFLALAPLCARAEEQLTEEVFAQHWYIQAHGGAQYTLGEIAFGEMISPNAQLGVGYNFTPCFGTRLSVNGWQSKGGFDYKGDNYKWDWYYIAPAIDATFDITNIIGGYKYDRLCSVGVFAGAGANLRLTEGNAKEQYALLSEAGCNSLSTEFVDNPSNVSFLGRAGLILDFKVSDRVKLGFEFSANGVSDKYNYKKASHLDWYFNALAGITVALGKKGTHTTKVVPAPVPVERIVERVVEVQVPCPEGTNAQMTAAESIRRDVFFKIGKSSISDKEMTKVVELAEFMQRNVQAKVTISGYADAQTGTASYNAKLSQKRAEAVAKVLKEQFGISAERIVVASYGSKVQPFQTNSLNRVSICVTE